MLRLSTFFLGGALMAAALVSGPAMADESGFKTKHAGDIVVRMRALAVMPSDGDAIRTDSNALAPTGTRVASTQVGNDYVPEIDVSYFITDNIAVEAIAGTTSHHVSAKDVLGTGTNLDMGDVRLLPPTITAQWHFFHDQRLSPYVGAGINYTIFYDERGGDSAFRNSIRFDNGWGPALQFGADFALTGGWSLNVDVKKLWLSTDVKATLAGAVPLKATADLNPWIVGVGVGYRF